MCGCGAVVSSFPPDVVMSHRHHRQASDVCSLTPASPEHRRFAWVMNNGQKKSPHARGDAGSTSREMSTLRVSSSECSMPADEGSAVIGGFAVSGDVQTF